MCFYWRISNDALMLAVTNVVSLRTVQTLMLNLKVSPLRYLQVTLMLTSVLISPEQGPSCSLQIQLMSQLAPVPLHFSPPRRLHRAFHLSNLPRSAAVLRIKISACRAESKPGPLAAPLNLRHTLFAHTYRHTLTHLQPRAVVGGGHKRTLTERCPNSDTLTLCAQRFNLTHMH